MAAQKNIAYILLYLAVPIVLVCLIHKQGKDSVLNFTRVAMMILAIGLVMKYINPSEATSHGGRLKGTFGNPNGLGMFCFFSYTLFIVCKDYLKCKISRIENIAFHSLILLSLLWSGSRGSLIGLLIFIIAKPLTKISPFLPFIIFPIPILFFDEITIFLVESIQDLGLQKALRVSSVDELKTGSGRAIAREFAWKEIQEAFFLGRGWRYDEIWIYGPIQQTLNLLNHQGGVHNSYLILWLNTGLVGIVLFFSALIYTVAEAAKKSNLAIPLFFGAMFVANFEPWLVGPLNPYTIQFIMCLAIFIYVPKGGDELSHENLNVIDNQND
ncbi:MAG: O-antigen ligase family protein [Flavobacteriales bacterium]|nr:O-antigen ligase family protein [Flavobacteriales bacterium]